MPRLVLSWYVCCVPQLVYSPSRLFGSVPQKGMPLIGLYFCFLPFPPARVYRFSCPMFAQCAVLPAGTILALVHCHAPVFSVPSYMCALRQLISLCRPQDHTKTHCRRSILPSQHLSFCDLQLDPVVIRPLPAGLPVLSLGHCHSPVLSATSASAA